MRRLLLVAALLPGFALAQSTRIVGPNGSGGTATAPVTSTYGLEVDVSRVQGANTTTSCAMNGAATTCAIATLGKIGCGLQVTAINAPVGITSVIEWSLDGGTTWKGTRFDDLSMTVSKPTTITSFVVGDTYSFIGTNGATNCRIRNTGRTSGDYTAQLTASDVEDPTVLFAGAPGSALPPAAVLMGGNDATTANLITAHIQPENTAANERLLTQPGVGRTAGTTGTCTNGNVCPVALDTNGVTYVAGKTASATTLTNPVVAAGEAQSSALGASATASQQRNVIVGLDGVLYTRPGSPLLFSGGVTAIAATLTQIVAAPAAGTSLYLSDIAIVSDTATAGSFTLRYGTGAACVTGTTTIFPNVSSITTGKLPYPGNTAAYPQFFNFSVPIKVPAANALCIVCVATNTCTATVSGFTAP